MASAAPLPARPPATAPTTAPTAVPMGPAMEPIAAPAAPPPAAPTPVPTGCEPGAPVIGSGFMSLLVLSLSAIANSFRLNNPRARRRRRRRGLGVRQWVCHRLLTAAAKSKKGAARNRRGIIYFG